MTDYDNLKKHVLKLTSMTNDELDEFCASFKLVKVKKRQFIVQPEFIARNRYYVVKGCFRAYVIGDEGQEHTIQFAIADWWTQIITVISFNSLPPCLSWPLRKASSFRLIMNQNKN